MTIIAFMTHSKLDDLERTSTLEDDIATFRLITNRETRDFETDLFATKWFDYRHLTPMQATRLYIQDYDTVYRGQYAANKDFRVASQIRTIDIDRLMADIANPASPRYVKAKRTLTACWHGRQVADLLCMPYDIYLELAFTFRLRYWNQQHLPRPAHLYSDMVIDKVQERWEEMQKAQLYLSEHPAYMVENYRDLPHQNDYHEWLFKQALARPNIASVMVDFVENGMLPRDKVEARLELEILERFREYIA